MGSVYVLSEGGGIFCDDQSTLAYLFRSDEGRLLTVIVVLERSSPAT